jgi:DNA uptake protein ComE-like DNA-binding protein
MAPQKNPKTNKGPLTASFTTGAIALVFLILGYQVALFVHRAAVTRLVANRDHPDTVYVVVPKDTPVIPGEANVATPPEPRKTYRKNATHAPEAIQVREKAARRPVESFRFDPNTVSLEDLQRLGFSEKQALAIDAYRQKGGRFRRPADFARSYVVADSVYERLAPYIDIPRVDINRADSVALLALPGIGPYFAGKVVAYRAQLGGYSRPEQLMEIYHFDEEKFAGLRDLITCSPPAPFALWALPEADLSRHPHISRDEAHSIVLFREHHRGEECTLEALRKAGVLSEDHFEHLSLCSIAPAQVSE